MSKKQKRLEKIRRNPRNVTFDELKQVLEDFGFNMRQNTGTSHYFFRAEIDESVWTLTVPYKRPHINAQYVKDVLKAIDEIIDQTSDKNDDTTNEE